MIILTSGDTAYNAKGFHPAKGNVLYFRVYYLLRQHLKKVGDFWHTTRNSGSQWRHLFFYLF